MIHIIYDGDKKPIGWEMIPTTKEEKNIAATVRNLTFFGFDSTHIEYDGMVLEEDKSVKSLTWKQDKHCKNPQYPNNTES